MDSKLIEQLQAAVANHREAMLTFFREIVAIPSMDSQIRAVGERVEQEMHKLGYDRVWWDAMGNVIGRIGDGEQVILYDSHLDTVGVGDPAEWDWDPFTGKVENGMLYARGACDEKASTPPMIYGLAIARDLGLLEGKTVYYFGNMEEWNEGSCAQAFVETEGIVPSAVIVGEPTDLSIARGQKGRVEYQIIARGKSAHAASNYLGDNALYKLLPIIDQIRQMEPSLPDDPFLGKARITVTDLHVETASANAVPNRAVAFVDRRLTAGEDAYTELERLQALVDDQPDIEIIIPMYDEPSYTGFSLPVEKIYPAWVMPEDHPLVQAAVTVLTTLTGTAQIGKWDFSTNGIYWAGKRGIPTIGYGPGEEQYAHTVLDQVRLDDVVASTAFYALLPSVIENLI